MGLFLPDGSIFWWCESGLSSCCGFGCTLSGTVGFGCCCSCWHFSGRAACIESACCEASSPLLSIPMVLPLSCCQASCPGATPLKTFAIIRVMPAPLRLCPHGGYPTFALSLASTSSFPSTVLLCGLPALAPRMVGVEQFGAAALAPALPVTLFSPCGSCNRWGSPGPRSSFPVSVHVSVDSVKYDCGRSFRGGGCHRCCHLH